MLIFFCLLILFRSIDNNDQQIYDKVNSEESVGNL